MESTTSSTATGTATPAELEVPDFMIAANASLKSRKSRNRDPGMTHPSTA